MKKIASAFLCFSIYATCFAGNNNGTPTANGEKSTFFKMSRNSNRVQLFENLQGEIKVKTSKSNFAVNTQPSTNQFTTVADLIQLLGEPNVIIKNTYIYTLNPATGCKAVIEFDAKKEVTFIAVKDCF